MSQWTAIAGRSGVFGREPRAVAVLEPALEPARAGRRSLADLLPGARAVVAQVTGVGSDPAARRLGELGFTPGTVVEVVRRAPLRDPVVYRVKDYEICLRRAQAAGIQVDLVQG